MEYINCHFQLKLQLLWQQWSHDVPRDMKRISSGSLGNLFLSEKLYQCYMRNKFKSCMIYYFIHTLFSLAWMSLVLLELDSPRILNLRSWTELSKIFKYDKLIIYFHFLQLWDANLTKLKTLLKVFWVVNSQSSILVKWLISLCGLANVTCTMHITLCLQWINSKLWKWIKKGSIKSILYCNVEITVPVAS